MHRIFCALALMLFATGSASAHDTWVQANTNIVRPGDNIHIDLMLGNHGNGHRDFKQAGKVDLGAGTLTVIDPDGKSYDIKDKLIDTGYAPTDGFWTTKFVGAKPGLYLAAHTFDKVMSYGPVRAVKSAKTYFVLTPSLDKVSTTNPGFDRVLGHPLELVPETNPVTPMGPGTPIKVKLLWKSKPLPNCQVSFIPRGETLTKEFDKRYERHTDADGRASFTPTAGNYYLVVAHKEESAPDAKDYKTIKYAATLTVFVPQVCPCCGD